MQFYLTTDGYLDQNGGEKSFPFNKKRFKALLDENKQPKPVLYPFNSKDTNHKQLTEEERPKEDREISKNRIDEEKINREIGDQNHITRSREDERA